MCIRDRLYAYSNGLGIVAGFEEEFDFSVDDGGWTTVVGNGVYVAATGWRTETTGVPTEELQIHTSFAARTITNVEITYSTGTAAAGGSRRIWRNGIETLALNAGIGAFVDDDNSTSSATSVQADVDTNTDAGGVRNWIFKIVITGLGSNPFGGGGIFSVTVYSTDHGATLDSASTVGESPANVGGVDTVKVGDVILAAADAQVRTAQSGGAYSDETNGALVGSDPTLIVIPYFQFNSSTPNINDATPEYLLGADVAVSGASLWRVTDGGKADVSITLTAVLTLITHPNAGHFCWHDNGKYAVLVNRSGTMHLVTTTDSFTANTDRGAIDADAIYVRMNKADLAGLHLFLADGGAGPAYSLDFGATIVNQPWPSATDVIIIEPYSGIG